MVEPQPFLLWNCCLCCASVAPWLSLFDEAAAIRLILIPVFMTIWLLAKLILTELFLRDLCVAVAPWLSLFDELVAIRLILMCMFMAISLLAKPHPYISRTVLAESLCGCGTMAKSVRWTSSNTANPVHVYGYFAKPHPSICGAVLTLSLCGCCTMANSVRWTSSYTADSCPCIFGYMAMWLTIRIPVWLQREGS
jgi:hypothetical protein